MYFLSGIRTILSQEDHKLMRKLKIYFSRNINSCVHLVRKKTIFSIFFLHILRS